MTEFRFERPVILAGGGSLAPGTLAAAQAALGGDAPVVAADGAGDALWAMGVRPAAIIGDLDSLADPGDWSARGVPVHRIADQDSTDFDKCLRATEAPLYLGVGFTGRRLDHGLAVLNTMALRPDKRVVLLSEHDCVLHLPAGLRLELAVAPGATISLFPLCPVRPGPCHGLVWPLDGLTLAPVGIGGGVIGTSNRAAGPVVGVSMQDDGVILTTPPAALASLLAALGLPVAGGA